MKLYLVCYEVDLGSHPVSIWSTPELAEAECKKFNEAYLREITYSHKEPYFIDELELDVLGTGWPLNE